MNFIKREFISSSPEETEKIAADFAKTIVPNDMVALFGGLGMGKTAFCRGFAKGLGFSGEVSSPTFAIVQEYLGGRLPVYHFDMYRIESYDDLYSTGYFEYLESGGAVITEWSENIENILPEHYYRVEISRTDGGDNERKILISSAENKID